MKSVLFTCVGTTDPVRGEHDGPMLHIMRHYRPEKVYIFFSEEIYEKSLPDRRFERTFEDVKARWDYAPEAEYILSGIKEVQDVDVLYAPMYEAVENIRRESPESEILINLTSGTPQMQMIMSHIALDTRYRARGIQVSNFERASGTSDRTNRRDYDIELELELNEDNEADAKNRCVEPRLFAVRREHTRQQVVALLEQRNFDAVEQLRDVLPEELLGLVRHLARRNRLHSGEALKLSQGLELPFKLYAYKKGDRAEYGRSCEYYLMMKNLIRAGNCTEFLLHMEPLTLQLQLAMLNTLLYPRRVKTTDFIVTGYKGNQMVDPALLQAACPELYAYYLAHMPMNWTAERRDVSIYACNILLDFFEPLPPKPAALFDCYEKLKELRNALAHELCTVTEEEIKAACGMDCNGILSAIEGTLMECYPACDPVIFSVYDRAIAYICEKL